VLIEEWEKIILPFIWTNKLKAIIILSSVLVRQPNPSIIPEYKRCCEIIQEVII